MQISNSFVVNPLHQNSQLQSSTPKRENPRHQKELKLNSISDKSISLVSPTDIKLLLFVV